MTYSIFQILTNKVAKDSEGYLHHYNTREQAVQVCEKLNTGAGKLDFVVKPT